AVIFRDRESLGFAVNHVARGENYLADAVQPHRLEHIVGGDRALFEIHPRMLCALNDIRVGGEVNYQLCVLHRFLKAAGVENIRLYKAKPRVGIVMLDEFFASEGQVVVGDDTMAVRQQAVDNMAAYKTRAAADEALHGFTPVEFNSTRTLLRVVAT